MALLLLLLDFELVCCCVFAVRKLSAQFQGYKEPFWKGSDDGPVFAQLNMR